jgi:hypothetical protein
VNSSLREINIASNKIGIEGAQSFAEVLKINFSLMKIILDYNEI